MAIQKLTQQFKEILGCIPMHEEFLESLIKAVKERDAFIIGSIPAIITVERYPSGNPKIINNRRLIIRLKEQRKRAEESR